MISGVTNSVACGEFDVKNFDQAIFNLDHYFDFVGVFESLHESIARLAKIIPIDASAIPRINIGEYKGLDIPVSTINLIKDLNKFDIELYEYMIGKSKEENNCDA